MNMKEEYQARLSKLPPKTKEILKDYCSKLQNMISDVEGVNLEVKFFPYSDKEECQRLIDEMLEIAGVYGCEMIGFDGDSDVFLSFDSKEDRFFVQNLLKGKI